MKISLQEKSLSAIMGTIALSYFGIKHEEPFNQDVFNFLCKNVYPIIDRHIRNPAPNTLTTAEQIAKLIQDFLKQEPSPLRSNSSPAAAQENSGDTGAADNANIGRPDDSESESEESSGTSIADTSSGNAKNGTPKTEPPAEQTQQGKEAPGCDVSSHMARQIEKGSTFTPPPCATIGEYHDTIANLADQECLSMSMTANTNLYQFICNEYKAVISSYRNMFGSFLVSTSRCRMLKTYAGRFNHRDVRRAALVRNSVRL
jgi:hypothetical protein